MDVGPNHKVVEDEKAPKGRRIVKIDDKSSAPKTPPKKDAS